MKVLLVEDDPRAAVATLRGLHRGGLLEVVLVCNPDAGQAAADAVRLLVCCEFDAVVLDGLDGLCRRVLRSPSCPDVAVVHTGEPTRYRRCGAVVVPKPTVDGVVAALTGRKPITPT